MAPVQGGGKMKSKRRKQAKPKCSRPTLSGTTHEVHNPSSEGELQPEEDHTLEPYFIHIKSEYESCESDEKSDFDDNQVEDDSSMELDSGDIKEEDVDPLDSDFDDNKDENMECPFYIKNEEEEPDYEFSVSQNQPNIAAEVVRHSQNENEDWEGLSSIQSTVMGKIMTKTPASPRSIQTEPKFHWTQECTVTNPFQYKLTPGLQVAPEGNSPIDYFNLIFTDELKEMILNETNRFAEKRKTLPTNGPKARVNRWKTLTSEEFMIWLALLYHMGHIKLPSLIHYWSTDYLYNLPFFRACMGRDRFLNILNLLRFVPDDFLDNSDMTNTLKEIQPLLDFFHKRMEALVTPTRQLCIDEPIILWRSKFVSCRYLRGRVQKCGVKLHTLAEPSGLVLNMVLNSGQTEQEDTGKGRAESIVHKLMRGKLDLGHSLFADDYYNNVNLAHELLEHKTYITGHLRPSRKGNPNPIIFCRISKGDSASLFSTKGVCVRKWKDKRDVLMISSEYGPKMVDVTYQLDSDKLIQVPEMYTEFNKLNSIDRIDQSLMYYPLEHKSLKNYKKLAIHIFHLILFNSYVIYRTRNPETKMSLYQFRTSIVKSLTSSVPNLTSPRNSCLPSTNHLPVRSTIERHIPKQRPPKENGRRPMRRCVVCLANKIRKETTFFCPACPGEPTLCLNCFATYHSDVTLVH